MKTFLKLLTLSLLVFCISFSFSLAAVDPTKEYQLLAPIPGLENVDQEDFAGYAQTIVNIVIGAAAVLAVLMFMFGGFMYMVGESLQTKGEGSKTMQNAVLGLLLILFSYLILETINPNLLNLNLKIDLVEQTVEDEEDLTSGRGADYPYCYISKSGPNRGESICFKSPTACERALENLDRFDGCTFFGQPLGDTSNTSLIHGEAIELLRNNGNITVTSSRGDGAQNVCSDPNKCRTSLQGIKADTINGLISLQQSCKCSVVVTGGTETIGGHVSGTYSHISGYKVDVSEPNLSKGGNFSDFSSYLVSIGAEPDGGFQTIEAGYYTYVFHAEPEDNHWDIKVCQTADSACWKNNSTN